MSRIHRGDHRRLRWACGLAACFLGMPWGGQEVSGQGRTDTIQLTEGTPLRGEVVRATADEVEVSQGGTTRTIPVSEIHQIRFGDEPPPLRLARDAALQHQWEQSLQALARIDADEVREPWIAEDVQFHRTWCEAQIALRQGTGMTEAAAAMLAFVKRHRDSRYTYQAAEALGALAQRLGRADRAAQFFGQLTQSEDPGTQVRGSLRLADLRRTRGSAGAAEALESYEKVLGAPPSNPAIRRAQRLATVGKCRCLALLGRADEGVRILETLVAEHPEDDSEWLAQLYLALGDCHTQLGNVQDAVLALLHVDLLFHDQSEPHAEALSRLSQLWPELGKPDRAADARRRLQTLYGGTRWAQP